MKGLISIMMIFSIINLCISCDSNKKITIDENLIQIISENSIYSSEIPPSYAFSIFFVRGDNGKIIKLDPRELEEIYYEDYSSRDYKKFVRKALNQELIIEIKNKGQAFELSKDIRNSYLSDSFTDFMKLYCEINSSGKYILKNDIPENQICSVLYYAFINNYLASFDDFLGVFYISDVSEYIDKKPAN